MVVSRLGITDVEEATPVSVHVVSPVRTAVEKLSIVHTAATDGSADRRTHVARHYYDLWCLLGDGYVAAELSDGDAVSQLAHDVLTYSKAAGLPVQERPADGYATSPAFDAVRPEARETREAFESQVRKTLVWNADTCPSFDEICAHIRDGDITL